MTSEEVTAAVVRLLDALAALQRVQADKLGRLDEHVAALERAAEARRVEGRR